MKNFVPTPPHNKVALVTGGSRGIGFSICQRLLKEGFRVAFCAHTEADVAKAEQQLSRFGEVFGKTVDVSLAHEVKEFVDKAHEHFGGIDVVVNNAGVAWTGQFDEQSIESIERIIDVNVKGLFFTTRQALPYLKEQEEAIIVNISSGVAKKPPGSLVVYSASKAAVNNFTESLAKEMNAESQSVYIYGLCLSRVATDMQEKISGKRQGMFPGKVSEMVFDLIDQHPPAQSGECQDVDFLNAPQEVEE